MRTVGVDPRKIVLGPGSVDMSRRDVIQELGLRETVRVRPRDGRYEIVSGEEAVRAILSLIDQTADCFDPHNGRTAKCAIVYETIPVKLMD